MKLIGSKATVELPEPGRRERQRIEREARHEEARVAAERRVQKSLGVSLSQRVADAQKELDRPLSQAVDLLTRLSPAQIELYALAESLGKNRKGVLAALPAVSATLRAQYEQEAGPTPQAAASE